MYKHRYVYVIQQFISYHIWQKCRLHRVLLYIGTASKLIGIFIWYFNGEILFKSHYKLQAPQWDSTSVGEENETTFIRVWKPLPSKCILETLRESPKGKARPGLLQMELEPEIGWCANEEVVPQREVDTRRCAIRTLAPKGGRFDGGPTSIGERNECQRGRWALKGMDLVVIPHQLEKGTSAHEDIEPWMGVDCEIPHRLGKSGFSDGPTSIRERNEYQRGRWALNGGGLAGP